MQAITRWPNISLFLITLLFLSAVPLSVEALEVRFCVPDCASDASTTTNTKGPGTTAPGTTRTTTLTIPSFTYKGFTISGTVTASQSGTLQKITFSPTTLTATATAGCTTTNPCRMEVVATTHWTDFILDKPTNVGYPAGVYMAGSFTGTQAASPNGDTISMTAEASGLKAAAGARAVGIIPGVPAISDSDRVAQDVINATPGAGTGDVAGVVAVVLHRYLDVQVHGDKLDEVVQHPDHRDGAAQV